MKSIYCYFYFVSILVLCGPAKLVAQVDKYFESYNKNGVRENSDYGKTTLMWSLILNEDSTFVLFFTGYTDNSTLTAFREYFSTGFYKKKGKYLTLVDTINDYTCEFKESQKGSYISIKGPSAFKGLYWKDVTYINRGMQLFEYEDKLYTQHYVKQGNNVAQLHMRMLSAKFISKSILPGIYFPPHEGDGYNLLIYDNSEFFILLSGIIISSGKWSYNLGRLDLYDPFFKHTYYCHLQSDSTMSYINFPLIHSSLYEDHVLTRMDSNSDNFKVIWNYYSKRNGKLKNE
jgi:hypothetical protein